MLKHINLIIVKRLSGERVNKQRKKEADGRDEEED